MRDLGGRIYGCTEYWGTGSSGNVCSEGRKSFWGPQQVCALLLFAGLQTGLSRQPPVFLLRSSSSCSDHLLWNQSQLRQRLTALAQDSDANCQLPREPELKDFFGWLCLQLCLKSSQSTSKCSVLLMGWAGGLNFTGEISSLSSHHLLIWWKSWMDSKSTDLWLQKLVFCKGFHKTKDKFADYSCFTVCVLCFCLFCLEKQEKMSPCALHICRVYRVPKFCGLPRVTSPALQPS